MIDKSFNLGRILVLAEKLYEHRLFHEPYWCRPKDACDWFNRQTDDKKYDTLHEIAYGLESISEEICEILLICKGLDEISERENGKNNGDI